MESCTSRAIQRPLSGRLFLNGGSSQLYLTNTTVRQIALKGIREAGSYPLADYRLLNGGWAHSDAVMISGQNIRSEESAMGAIQYDILIHVALHQTEETL